MVDHGHHNPFTAPAAVEQQAILRDKREFPTPLFQCVIAVLVFEIILAPVSMAHLLWPKSVEVNLSLPCLILNVVVLIVVSWKIGRRVPVVTGVPLSLIVVTFAWLSCIVVANIMNSWNFSSREWKYVLLVVAITIVLCAIATAIASSTRRNIADSIER